MSVMVKPLRVMMLGLRGFPDVQGGVEVHAQHLCTQLVELGCEVEVVVRTPYVSKEKARDWHGVKFCRIWSPRSKGLEAIAHTLLGVIYAIVRRPDVLHIQAIGPALLAPLARAFGLRVVITHHSLNYDHQKWGGFAKWVLRTGERWGMVCANERIVISKIIYDLVNDKYGLDSNLIPNGVVLPDIPETKNALDEFNLSARKYVLLVSRLVPEKRHLDLIQSFARANMEGWKLVLVGSSDHPDEYTQNILKEAESTLNVVCTGFQTDITLQELYANAGLFVLPSSHEGLPIALLEALSYGLYAICSDIPANLEVGLMEQQYYPLGDIDALARQMRDRQHIEYDKDNFDAQRAWLRERYDWRAIACSTLAVYSSACGRAHNVPTIAKNGD